MATAGPRDGGNFYPAISQQREQVTKTATIASGGTESGALDIGGYSAGMFLLSSEFNTDTMTILVSNTESGTYAEIYTDGSIVAASTFAGVTDKWNEIPAAVMAAGFLKIKTGTATAAIATITFSLKTN